MRARRYRKKVNSSADKRRRSRDELVLWLLEEARELAASPNETDKLIRVLDDIAAIVSGATSSTAAAADAAFDPAFRVVR